MFNKNSCITLYSPVKGKLKYLSSVNDNVFSSKILGDGIAIIPYKNDVQKILSPVDGKVVFISKTNHAFVIKSKKNVKIYIHIGIDTSFLKKEIFSFYVQKGAKIKKGDLILEVDFLKINEKNKINDFILIIENNSLKKYNLVFENKNFFNQMDPIFKLNRK